MDYRQLARDAARQYGLPENLFLAQIQQESGFNPNARSPAGAMGLGQLMPGTAGDLGVSNPWDARQNLDGAARYMRQQLDKFGTPELALAAYNAGPGNVQKHGGIPPFEETQNYVRSIMGSLAQPVAFSRETTAPQTASEQRPGLLGRASTDPLVGSSGNDTLGANPMAEPSAVSGLLSRLLNRDPAAPLSPMAPKERGSLWDRLKSPDTLANLAIGLQGMTIDPNEAFMSSLQGEVDSRKDDAKLQRTVEWLAQQPGGADYAAAISAGMSPQAAIDGFMDARQGLTEAEQIALARAGIGLEADQLRLAGLQGGGGDPGVRASQILPNGLVVQSTDTGVRVFSPGGQELTGPEAEKAIIAAREQENQWERDKYGSRREGTLGADVELGGAAANAQESGKLAAQAAADAHASAATLKSGLSTINEAIAAIDSGAQAGMVYNMLPNITLESASLSNAMDRMGLDVISATTFGALSEGELRLAMETAVPRNLEPTQLREWLTRRKAAQEKTIRMMEDAAIYLGTPGNTIAGWTERNRNAPKPEKPAPQPAPQAAPRASPAQPQQAPQPAPQPAPQAAPRASPAQPQQAPQPAPQPAPQAAPRASPAPTIPTPAEVAGMDKAAAIATIRSFGGDVSAIPTPILKEILKKARE